MTEMIAIIAETSRWILFAVGAFFILTGAFGILRLPEFYSRLHAAGLTDTLGAAVFLLAMMIGADWLTALKLFLFLVFLFITAPTATHALASAARTANIKPLLARAKPRLSARP